MNEAATLADSDTSATNGTASDNAHGATDTGNLNALINRTVTQALSTHMKRFEERLAKNFTSDVVAKAIEAKLEAMAQATETATGETHNMSNGEKPTLKALESQLTQLRQQIQTEQKARQEAEHRAVDARTRAEVQGMFAKYFGADNPQIGLLMDSYYDVRKRFVRDDSGNSAVLFKRNYGDEHVPLEQGFKELVDTELKHLVPARNANLPSASTYPTRGQPYNGRGNGGVKPPLGMLQEELLKGLASRSPELAQQYVNAAEEAAVNRPFPTK